MSYELIALLMFSSMMLMLMTGQVVPDADASHVYLYGLCVVGK